LDRLWVVKIRTSGIESLSRGVVRALNERELSFRLVGSSAH
jgi:hypothetical protein